MSRCKACDVILNEQDMTRKGSRGDYIDLCYTCYSVSLATEWGLEEEENSGNISLDDYFSDVLNYDTLTT